MGLFRLAARVGRWSGGATRRLEEWSPRCRKALDSIRTAHLLRLWVSGFGLSQSTASGTGDWDSFSWRLSGRRPGPRGPPRRPGRPDHRGCIQTKRKKTMINKQQLAALIKAVKEGGDDDDEITEDLTSGEANSLILKLAKKLAKRLDAGEVAANDKDAVTAKIAALRSAATLAA